MKQTQHIIHYAAVSHKGKVREKNQDNFCCADMAAVFDSAGGAELISGIVESAVIPSFAVFDGMGGEQRGEVASQLATETFRAACANVAVEQNKEALLSDVCAKMNASVCAFSSENLLRRMGTTAAILLFDSEYAYVCNVGDSRIYLHERRLLARGGLTQISLDHSQKGVTGRKAPLTQYVGVPENEFIIEPYIVKWPLRSGSRWLICSDGLTDMVSDKEILKLLSAKGDVSVCARRLLETALAAGGKDNVTIILLEVQGEQK
jgi:protein phosphatase